MSDRSPIQITIHKCPEKRREVAGLLSEYVGLEYEETPPLVAVGKEYMAIEMTLGSMVELAARLIALAPRCAFIGWQDPFELYLGEFVAYCPRWGRFDADCTGEGGVVLAQPAITAITDAADPHGYHARDALLRLHAGDVIPAQLAAWQSRPGVAEALEVAYGVPWLQHAKGIKQPKAKRLAWAAVIDRLHQEDADARHARLTEHAARVEQLGLAGHAQALQAATDLALAPDTARAAADAAAAILAPVTGARSLLASLLSEQAAAAVQKELSPFAYLPDHLRWWAEAAEIIHQGRRQP